MGLVSFFFPVRRHVKPKISWYFISQRFTCPDIRSKSDPTPSCLYVLHMLYSAAAELSLCVPFPMRWHANPQISWYFTSKRYTCGDIRQRSEPMIMCHYYKADFLLAKYTAFELGFLFLYLNKNMKICMARYKILKFC